MKKITTILTLLVFTIIFSQIPSYVPTNGLVGYWHFNGNANDESGNGNNGTINGATLTTDRFGNSNNAYSFDGLSNFIEIPSSSSLQVKSAYTISTWVFMDYQNYQSIDQHSIISKIADGDWYGGYELRINNLSNSNNVGAFSTAGNIGGVNIGIGTPNVVTAQWYFVTVTYDSSVLKIYLNNIEVGNTLISGNLQTSNNRLRFGRRGEGNSYNCWYKGKIDDIGIWNRALTQQEITGLYNAANANECQSLVINTGILSFNPVTYNNTVTVYPNPANDQITIDCGTIANVKGYQIKIVNTLGQEVFSGAMNTQQYVVPLNTWGGPGIYLVKIYDAANNLLNTKKIILQ
jgi:hypothetical protein